MKEGGDFPFYGFPELWVGKYRKVNPSWEIFEEKLTFKEKPTMVIKEVQEEVTGWTTWTLKQWELC